jgi:hypothetical protein
MIAISLWPSCLTSCSQPSPSGGSEAVETIFGRTVRGRAAGTAEDGKNSSGMRYANMVTAGHLEQSEPRPVIFALSYAFFRWASCPLIGMFLASAKGNRKWSGHAEASQSMPTAILSLTSNLPQARYIAEKFRERIEGYLELSASAPAGSSQTQRGRSLPRRSTPALRRTSISPCRIGRLDGHSA